MSDQLGIFGDRVEIAAERFREALAAEGEAECPCCGHRARRYRRRIHATMARWLVALDLKTGDTGRALHRSKIIGETPRDEAIMRHWGLIEAGRSPGTWRITEAGRMFARRESRIPCFVDLVENQAVGFAGCEVDIVDALGSAFEYEALTREAS